MLIWPMLLGTFQPPKPENRILPRGTIDGHLHIFMLFSPSAGCAHVLVTLEVESALAAVGRGETVQRALPYVA
jgi:hypothetical protein